MKTDDFKGLKSEPVFSVLWEFFKNGKTIKFFEFKKKVSSTLFSDLSRILIEGGKALTEQEIQDCVDSLKQHALQNKLKSLNAHIKSLEKKGEKEGLNAALREKQEITEKLSNFSRRS